MSSLTGVEVETPGGWVASSRTSHLVSMESACEPRFVRRPTCIWAQSLSRVPLFVTSWTVAHQGPLFMKLSRQDYWSGLPLPTLGDLPHPWIKPMSPALAGGFLTISTPGKPKTIIWPSNPTTGHIPWENHGSKRHMYPDVHCSTIYNSQDMKPT